MTYSRFEVRVLPIFIYYIILSIFGIYITLKLIQKYQQRKEKPLLHLACVFISFLFAVIVLAIGLAEAAITGYYKEVYRASLPLAYSLIIVGNVLLFYFATNITNSRKKAFIPMVLIGIVLIIIIFLPWNWWGVPSEDYEGKLNIRLYTNIGIIAFSYTIYIMIISICQKAKNATEDKIAKAGFSLLSYSMISMLMFFVMILGDNFMIVLYNHPGYSEFIYIAWLFAILMLIFSYLSLVMPDWLKKRVTD